jgi:hypothetical protein
MSREKTKVPFTLFPLATSILAEGLERKKNSTLTNRSALAYARQSGNCARGWSRWGPQAEHEGLDGHSPALASVQVGRRAECSRDEMENVESRARPHENGRGQQHWASGHGGAILSRIARVYG